MREFESKIICMGTADKWPIVSILILIGAFAVRFRNNKRGRFVLIFIYFQR